MQSGPRLPVLSGNAAEAQPYSQVPAKTVLGEAIRGFDAYRQQKQPTTAEHQYDLNRLCANVPVAAHGALSNVRSLD